MASPAHPESFEMADYLRVLRRRWWIVVAVTCIGTLAAAGYVVKSAKQYTATASIFVNANAATSTQAVGSRTAGIAVNMDNEAQVATSNAVAAPAAQALHTTMSPAQLVKRVSVIVPANTTLLDISCSGPTARWAASCAQTFANSYLNYRETTAKGKVGFEVTQLEKREAALLSKQQALKRQIHTLPPRAPKRASLSADIKNTKAELATVRAGISALSGSVSYNPGYVLTPAAPPSAPSSPKALLALPSGLVVGLLLGLVAAFAVDRRDKRIYAPRDLERHADLPVLLSMPHRNREAGSGLIPARSGDGRAFTGLAEAVASGLGDGNHVLFVAASSPGAGGSVVAANLAAALARVRSEVLLVCADLPGSGAAQLLGIGEGPGFAELLVGSATLAEATHSVATLPRLRVIPPGSPAVLIGELDYDECQRLLGDLRRDTRYVIILARAVGAETDTFTLAEFADAALVVAEIPRSRRDEVAECVARLERLRTPVLGAAAVAADYPVPAAARGGPAWRGPGAARGQPHRPAERGGPLPPSLEPALQPREAAATPPAPAPAPRARKG